VVADILAEPKPFLAFPLNWRWILHEAEYKWLNEAPAGVEDERRQGVS
jgi:hypothetical protein